MTPAPTPPSGAQFELRHGAQRVVVTEVGGGLRSYTAGGRPVLDGFDVAEMCSGARGQTLLPWPNRIAGGRYRFDGAEHVLALTEPEAHNAIHGLTRWANWTPVEQGGELLRLRHTLHAQQGWPFVLDCELEYRLGPGGLGVRTSATNVGAAPCPYATGAHPYLTVGTPLIDSARVTVPGRTCYPTDARGVPTGRVPVASTRHDLTGGPALGDRALDVAYTDLVRDEDGRARVRMSGPDGTEVALWVGAAYPYLQVFTGDTLPQPHRRRRGLGVEPMTAAPNAFNTGDGLRTLAPGESHTAEWGIEPPRALTLRHAE